MRSGIKSGSFSKGSTIITDSRLVHYVIGMDRLTDRSFPGLFMVVFLRFIFSGIFPLPNGCIAFDSVNDILFGFQIAGPPY